MVQDTMSEQEQNDPDAEFVEIDPTGRYGRVKFSFTNSFSIFFFDFWFEFVVLIRIKKNFYSEQSL